MSKSKIEFCVSHDGVHYRIPDIKQMGHYKALFLIGVLLRLGVAKDMADITWA